MRGERQSLSVNRGRVLVFTARCPSVHAAALVLSVADPRNPISARLCPSLPVSDALLTLATPKSPSLMSPPWLMKMFCVFRSRWRIFRSCTCLRARQSCTNMSRMRCVCGGGGEHAR